MKSSLSVKHIFLTKNCSSFSVKINISINNNFTYKLRLLILSLLPSQSIELLSNVEVNLCFLIAQWHFRFIIFSEFWLFIHCFIVFPIQMCLSICWICCTLICCIDQLAAIVCLAMQLHLSKFLTMFVIQFPKFWNGIFIENVLQDRGQICCRFTFSQDWSWLLIRDSPWRP